jgi:hypothetical protein
MSYLLSESLGDIGNQLEETIQQFILPPFYYDQDVVDEALDIIDRILVLSEKLESIDFTGSFRYE